MHLNLDMPNKNLLGDLAVAADQFVHDITKLAEQKNKDLDSQLWQDQISKKNSQLKPFVGKLLVQSPQPEFSLTTLVLPYSLSTAASDGILRRPKDQDNSADTAAWTYGDFQFLNPFGAELHLKILKRQVSLEHLLDRDALFLEKMQTTYDLGWFEFLKSSGFYDAELYSHRTLLANQDFYDKLRNNPVNVLVSPSILTSVQTAYDKIQRRHAHIKSKRAQFDSEWQKELTCRIAVNYLHLQFVMIVRIVKVLAVHP